MAEQQKRAHLYVGNLSPRVNEQSELKCLMRCGADAVRGVFEESEVGACGGRGSSLGGLCERAEIYLRRTGGAEFVKDAGGE